jgi:uncharacterized membrane protein
MWQKLSKYYPPYLELVSFSLLVFTLYLASSNYTTLPDIIPTHFNTQGIADNYGSKTTIFFILSFMLLSMFFSLFSTSGVSIIAKNPRALINLPAKRKTALSDKQVEALRATLNRYPILLKIVIQGLFTYILYITIEIAWGCCFFLFSLAVLAVTGLMVWKAFQTTKPTKPGLV